MLKKAPIVVILCLATIGVTASLTFVSAEENYSIPTWIKNSAKWWGEGLIGDSDFISGIKYLIENDIMIIKQDSNYQPSIMIEQETGIPVEYNVIFMTSSDNCTWEEFGKMHFYNEVTYYYLQEWGLEPTYVDPLCLPNTVLDDVPEEYLGYDLTILMGDYVITQKYLIEYSHAWGYYDTSARMIVSGELTDFMAEAGLLTVDDIASEWVLTHELSHFVLDYLGEPESIMVDWVHDTENWNRFCILEDPYHPTCDEIYSELEVNGMRVLVMEPYAYYIP